MQQEERDKPTSPFHHCKMGNLRALKEFLKENPEYINVRDTCGGTLFHTAYLYEQFRLCHWLVENYPKEALHPYSQTVELNPDLEGLPTFRPIQTFIDEERLVRYESFRSHNRSVVRQLGLKPRMYATTTSKSLKEGGGEGEGETLHIAVEDEDDVDLVEIPADMMPYTGENILHIIIVRRNLEETRWLLDFYRNHQYSVPGGMQALFNANVTGCLFHPRKSLYFGGYPLHFAVCSNDVNIFDLVLSFASATTVLKHNYGQKPAFGAQKQGNSAMSRSTSPSTIGGSSIRMVRTVTNTSVPFRGNAGDSSPGPGGTLSSKGTTNNLFSLLQNSNTRTTTQVPVVGGVISGIISSYVPPPCDRELYRCDNYGNNVLHFCVIHGLKEMYSHIRRTASRLIRRELKLAVINFRKSGIQGKTFRLEPAFGQRQVDNELCYPPVETEIVWPAFSAEDSDSIPEAWYDEIVHKKVDERLIRVLNCAFHSPITFAADVTPHNCKAFNMSPDVEMLTLLLAEEFTPNWQYGPTQSSLVKIVGLEKPYIAEQYVLRPLPPTAKMYGVIEWLCKSKFEDALTIPVIAQLIQNKWKVIGKPTFRSRLALHVVFTFFMTVIAFFPYRIPFGPSVDHPLEKFADRFVATAYICNLFIICYNLYTDAPYLLKLGLDWWGIYGGIRGAARFDRYLRTIMVSSFSIVIVLKGASLRSQYTANDQVSYVPDIGSASPTLQTTETLSLMFVSLCVGVCWLYFFFFFLGYKELAPFLLIIYRIINNDFTYFFQFYGIIVVSFGIPTSVLSNEGSNSAEYGLQRSLLAMWALLQDTVGMNPTLNVLNLEDVGDWNLVWVMNFYITLFYVVVVLLLVNLLIGMIGNTYAAFIQSPLGLVLLEQYNILSAIEMTSSSSDQRRMLLKYTTTIVSESMLLEEEDINERNEELADEEEEDDNEGSAPDDGGNGTNKPSRQSAKSAKSAKSKQTIDTAATKSSAKTVARLAANLPGSTRNLSKSMRSSGRPPSSLGQLMSFRGSNIDGEDMDDDAAAAIANQLAVSNKLMYEYEFEVFDDNWKHHPTTINRYLLNASFYLKACF
jgi:hypothetical protein